MSKKVLATGVFDLLHPGHIFYLKECSKLGSLIVLITSDNVARKEGKNLVFSEKERLLLIKSLVFVDKAVIGNPEFDECLTVLQLKPDIIALGFDQKYNIANLRKKLYNCGWKGGIVRVKKYPNKNQSSTNIKRTIVKRSKQDDL